MRIPIPVAADCNRKRHPNGRLCNLQGVGSAAGAHPRAHGHLSSLAGRVSWSLSMSLSTSQNNRCCCEQEAPPTDMTAMEYVIDKAKADVRRLEALAEDMLEKKGPEAPGLQVCHCCCCFLL